MNKPPNQHGGLARPKAALAVCIAVFLVAGTLPYGWLIANFGYDDILREPAETILTKFHAGGTPLVLAWFAFAMSALLFIPVAMGFEKLLSGAQSADTARFAIGLASALVQTVGLLRWVLVVPALASSFVAPDLTQSMRESLTLAFDVVHRYGGMVLGEMVGQLLLAGWTALVALPLYRKRLVPRWIGVIGLLTVPLWIVGQTELLHGVAPAIPSIEVIPLAFMAWELWLLLVAVALALSAWKESRHD